MRPKIILGAASAVVLVLLASALVMLAILVSRPAAATTQAAEPTSTPLITTATLPAQTPTVTAGVPTQAATPEATPNPSRKITVASVGQVKVVPDVAFLNVGSEVQAPTAAEAMTKAASTSEALRQALLLEGVNEHNIQTSGINVYPVSDPTNMTKGPTAYRSSFNLYVSIYDLGNAGKILDSVAKAGANQISGLSYGLKDDTTYRAQALEKAIQQARPKAEAIARTVGAEISQVITVEEAQNSYYNPVPAYGLGGKADAAGTSIAPGELTISVQVIVSYGIR